MLLHIAIFIVVGDKMPKADKKDDKRIDKRMERVPERKIYLDDDDEPSAKTIELTPKSIKKPDYDDVKLKDIIERAKENDPSKNKPVQAVPVPGTIFPSYASSQRYAEAISASKEESKKEGGDGIRIFMFIGVVIGLVILLTLFGGTFSPLALLGSTVDTKPTADSTKTVAPVVIPAEKPSETAPAEKTQNNTVITATKNIDIVISNWRLLPNQINTNVGSTVVIQFTTADLEYDVYVDGFDVKKHVEPGEPAVLAITAIANGTHIIHAITWNAGRMVEATGLLIIG